MEHARFPSRIALAERDPPGKQPDRASEDAISARPQPVR
jgi:hypothetical protein